MQSHLRVQLEQAPGAGPTRFLPPRTVLLPPIALPSISHMTGVGLPLFQFGRSMTSSFKSAIEQAIENFEAAAHAAEALETPTTATPVGTKEPAQPPVAPDSAAQGAVGTSEVVPGGHAVKMKGFLGPILTR